jgi:hypothetical protein
MHLKLRVKKEKIEIHKYFKNFDDKSSSLNHFQCTLKLRENKLLKLY